MQLGLLVLRPEEIALFYEQPLCGSVPLQQRCCYGLRPTWLRHVHESVCRFIELTAAELGWGGIEWSGEGLEKQGRRAGSDEVVVVRIDPRYFRPAEVETLLGDPTRAREKLGWTPTTTLEELVAEMVATDKEEAKKEALLRLKGFNVVGSMENPPTNPHAVERARGGLG